MVVIVVYLPRYELLVSTQKIFNGSTIASAVIGVISISHHSNIVAQYHHNRTKLYIFVNDWMEFSVVNTEYRYDLVGWFVFLFGSMWFFGFRDDNKNWISACIPFDSLRFVDILTLSHAYRQIYNENFPTKIISIFFLISSSSQL